MWFKTREKLLMRKTHKKKSELSSAEEAHLCHCKWKTYAQWVAWRKCKAEISSSDIRSNVGIRGQLLTLGSTVHLKEQEHEKIISYSPAVWTCVITGWEVIPTMIIISLAKSLRQLSIFYLGNLTSKSSPKLSLNHTNLCSWISVRKQINSL